MLLKDIFYIRRYLVDIQRNIFIIKLLEMVMVNYATQEMQVVVTVDKFFAVHNPQSKSI